MRIQINEIEFGYNSTSVLNEVSLEVDSGEFLGIIGPNGSGKTTLLRCINRILRPRAGCIMVDEDDLSSLDRKEIARNMGYVPQAEKEEFPATVFDTILMGRKPYINWRPSTEDLEVVSKVIKMLGLEPLAMRDVDQLSDGQKQKVIMARALAQEPEVLLLDEPTSNLDLRHQLEVLDLARKQTMNGVSVVMAIHDLNLAARYSDKIIMLNDGRVFAAGGREVLTPGNIEPVYGVRVSVINDRGRTIIIPESKSENTD